MNDTDTQEKEPKKKLSLSRPGKLELKKTIEGGQVRQSFSHGRSKVVAVEVRKKRTFAPGAGGTMREVRDEEAEAAFESAGTEAAEMTPVEVRIPLSEQHLTEHERQVRAKALQEARRAEEERQSRAVVEDERRDEDDLRRVAEEEAKRLAEEEARKAEEETRRKAEEAEARRRAEQGEAAAVAGVAKLKQHAEEGVVEEEDDSESARARRGKVAPKRPPARTRGEPRRRSGKLTITDALEENERVRSLASMRRAREKQKKKEIQTERVKVVREVTIPETITVNELSNRMAERGVEVIRTLMKMGVIATLHQEIGRAHV